MLHVCVTSHRGLSYEVFIICTVLFLFKELLTAPHSKSDHIYTVITSLLGFYFSSLLSIILCNLIILFYCIMVMNVSKCQQKNFIIKVLSRKKQ